jgi:hypothetical protein
MMRVRNSAWDWRERVNFKRRFKGGDRGPFVRQDELSTQGVYVKVLWLAMASRRGEVQSLCRKDWNLQLDKAPGRPALQINSTKIVTSGVEKGYLTARSGTKPGGAACNFHGEFDEEDQAAGRGYCPLDDQNGS